MRKLPTEAFDHYVSLGLERSYQAVADRYGVSKVAVVNRAKAEDWQGRLKKIDAEARSRSEKKAVEDLEAVRDRQLKATRLVQTRALEAIRSLPPDRAVKAAAVLNIAWKHELLLLGEPLDRTEMSVEEVTREEMRKWLIWEKPKEVKDGDAGAAASA